MDATFTLKNNPSEITRVIREAVAFWNCSGLPDTCIHEARLSLEELLMNIISYGYDDGAEHIIKIEMRIADDCLHIETNDDGKTV